MCFETECAKFLERLGGVLAGFIDKMNAADGLVVDENDAASSAGVCIIVAEIDAELVGMGG